jgi:hypothetical protein
MDKGKCIPTISLEPHSPLSGLCDILLFARSARRATRAPKAEYNDEHATFRKVRVRLRLLIRSLHVTLARLSERNSARVLAGALTVKHRANITTAMTNHLVAQYQHHVLKLGRPSLSLASPGFGRYDSQIGSRIAPSSRQWLHLPSDSILQATATAARVTPALHESKSCSRVRDIDLYSCQLCSWCQMKFCSP